jgi:hypothetical protein
MQKDSKLVWVVEYLIGIGFLVAVLPYIVHPQSGWSPAHGWAYLLFIACAGIALISSASETRQRLEMSERIKKLEKKLEEQESAPNQTQNTSGPQFISKEHLVGSVN